MKPRHHPHRPTTRTARTPAPAPTGRRRRARIGDRAAAPTGHPHPAPTGSADGSRATAGRDGTPASTPPAGEVVTPAAGHPGASAGRRAPVPRGAVVAPGRHRPTDGGSRSIAGVARRRSGGPATAPAGHDTPCPIAASADRGWRS